MKKCLIFNQSFYLSVYCLRWEFFCKVDINPFLKTLFEDYKKETSSLLYFLKRSNLFYTGYPSVGKGQATVASFIDNIINEHFAIHAAEIKAAFDEGLKAYRL